MRPSLVEASRLSPKSTPIHFLLSVNEVVSSKTTDRNTLLSLTNRDGSLSSYLENSSLTLSYLESLAVIRPLQVVSLMASWELLTQV